TEIHRVFAALRFPGNNVLARLEVHGLGVSNRFLDVFREKEVESADEYGSRRNLSSRSVLPIHRKFGTFGSLVCAAFGDRGLELFEPFRKAVVGVHGDCSSDEQRDGFHSTRSARTRT